MFQYLYVFNKSTDTIFKLGQAAVLIVLVHLRPLMKFSTAKFVKNCTQLE